MPTPPRKIERLPATRVNEIAQLTEQLEHAIDYLNLAGVYAESGDSAKAGERLDVARRDVDAVLEELNTFRAPAPAPKRNGTPAQEPE